MNFVNIRNITGGPSPSGTLRMFKIRKEKLEKEGEAYNQRINKLVFADNKLKVIMHNTINL